MDCGLTLSKADIYNLSDIRQATKPHVFIQAAGCIFIWKYWSSLRPTIPRFTEGSNSLWTAQVAISQEPQLELEF